MARGPQPPGLAAAALEAMRESGRPITLPIHGTSMHPFLKAGDTVRIVPVAPGELRLGDVMAFWMEGRVTVHRFVGWKAGALRQKGDNLRTFCTIPPEALIGRVEAKGDRPLSPWRNRALGLLAWARCRAVEALRPAPKEGLAPLDRVLLLAARLELGPPEAEELASLLPGLDWDALLAEASRFGVEGLLRRHCADPLIRPLVPAPALAALDKAYLKLSMRNLRMQAVLRRLLAGLREAELPVILLKGAHVAPELYGDIALRPMGDLDLLFRLEDRRRVWERLQELGLRAGHTEDATPFSAALDRESQLRIGHIPPLFFEKVCMVEVHFFIMAEATGPDRDPMAGVWERRVPCGEAWSLSPEDELVHLASHLHEHLLLENAPSLYWFCDVFERIRQTPALDWEAVTRIASERDKLVPLQDVLTLLQEHWGLELPPGMTAGGALRMEALLRAGRSGGEDRHGYARGVLLKARSVQHAGGPLARAGLLLALVFPSPSRLHEKYGVRGLPALALWYLARPFLLAGRLLRSLGSHVQRRLRH